MSAPKPKPNASQPPPALTPEEMEALCIYTQTDAKESDFARVLLIGPAKAGKTTCLLTTAPPPILVLNCDGLGATGGAVRQDAEFMALDVDDLRGWQHGVRTAHKLANAGKVRTIVLDTFTLLIDTLRDEMALTLSGFDLWRELNDVVGAGVKQLLAAPAHLFITTHLAPGHDEASGILPDVPGKMSRRLPSLMADWIILDVEPERKPYERTFLLGPQKYWTHSGRRIKRTCQIEANVLCLLSELGIKP